MSKVLAMFGATGSQGSSVITTVLADSALRDAFSIRALTRNATSQAAQALRSRGVQVATFDPESRASLQAAVKDAHTVFLMTTTDYDAPKEHEVDFARRVIDAAISENTTHLIFSTLPSPSALSGGKYAGVDGFDAKAEIEEYIRSSSIKRSFYAPGTFMNNFLLGMKPRANEDGTYSIAGVASPSTHYPLIDTTEDTGKYVAALLLDPEKHTDKVLCCASQLLTMDQITHIYSQVTGKPVNYQQLPVDVFSKFIPNRRMATNVTEMTLYFQDFGYFGADTETKIDEAQKVAKGRLTTFEEFLIREKPDLDAPAW